MAAKLPEFSDNIFRNVSNNTKANPQQKRKGDTKMKGITSQQGRETLNKFKMEAANEVGVNLKQGYNGDLTAREVGSVGGQMVNMMGAEQQWRFERKRPQNLGGDSVIYIFCQVGI